MEKEKRKNVTAEGQETKGLCEASEWYAVRVWRCSESISCGTRSFEMVSK